MTNYRFCPLCAGQLEMRDRGGLPRPTCPACGFVHYRNPAVGVAVVLVEDGNILMGRRSRGRIRGALVHSVRLR